MQKLLSLPPNLVSAFYELENVDRTEWFCTSDPVGMKLGSGGGTTWLLREWYRNQQTEHSTEKRILLHAGGQSRRLPGYAPSGKILTPIPVFRWARGQKLGQNLLSLQVPLYEKIMERAPEKLRTLIASGDVYIRAEKPLQDIPDADVVCYGLWVDPVLATHHGVFVSDRKQPEALDFMLQKPSLQELENLSKTHLFLSNHPRIIDDELNKLSVAILPLPGGEFYHYGTSRELLSSTVTLQNKVYDQRQIMHRKVKPNPAIFVQNAEIGVTLSSNNDNLWIENSFVGASWKIGSRQIITGVPRNDWTLALPDGVCVDIVPLAEKRWVVRPYGFDDVFKGDIQDEKTLFLGMPFIGWLAKRGLTPDDVIGRKDDLQAAGIFPVVEDIEQMGKVLCWMTSELELAEGKKIWLNSQRLSADEISAKADLRQLYAQRESWLMLPNIFIV